MLAYEEEWRTPPAAGFEQEEPALAAARRRRATALARLPQAELVRLAAGALRNMRAQRGLDLTAELSAIQTPTLIVHGDADTTVPIEFGQSLAAAIPRAERIAAQRQSPRPDLGRRCAGCPRELVASALG